MILNIKHVKMSVLPNFSIDTTQFESKSQQVFFKETEKLLLKCIWKFKRPRKQNNFEKIEV